MIKFKIYILLTILFLTSTSHATTLIDLCEEYKNLANSVIKLRFEEVPKRKLVEILEKRRNELINNLDDVKSIIDMAYNIDYIDDKKEQELMIEDFTISIHNKCLLIIVNSLIKSYK